MIHELADALHIDLETRSRINLRQTGPYVYFQDWSTKVWVGCFARGDGPVEAWYPGDPVPRTIIKAYEDRVPFVAHNVGFERVGFAEILGPQHGWPIPPLEQWWCTASMCAALALPRDLKRALLVLGADEQKDMGGNELIRRMMKPYHTEKIPCLICGEKQCDHPERFKLRLLYHETPEEIKRGTEYCKQDVRGERSLLNYIRPLSASERKIWLLDQRMNERGVQVDLPAVANAQKIVASEMAELNGQIKEVTGDWLTKATQAQKLRMWCVFEGLDVSNLRRDTIRDLLLDSETLDAVVRQALELRLEAAKSSTAKLNAFERRTCADGRMRDNLMYHGAGTGRWSGRGAQLQNMPSRFVLAMCQKMVGAEMIRAGATGFDIRWTVFESPLEIVSSALRGMIVAGPGQEFTVGDFNAIEARGTAWLAGAEGLLGVFSRDEDPYLFQAAGIYTHVDLSWVNWSDKKSVDKAKKVYERERALGKIAVLGLGYQMGFEKFITTCWKERIPLTRDESRVIVDGYRDVNFQIKELWADMEDAAFNAVRNPEKMFSVAGGKIVFCRRGSWLMMRLPNGRLLWYANPSIKRKKMPWIDKATGKAAERWGVVYWGVDSTTHQWCEQNAYGGKWTENAVQALCRDILAEAMLRLEDAGYFQVLSVHDESVSEHPIGFGSKEEFKQIMEIVPDWAEGMPIRAEVWRGPRYRK